MEETYPYKRTCHYCKATFEGRRNAKFCDPGHKALYHAEINRHRKKQELRNNERFREIIEILIKNCKIIDDLKEKSDSKIIHKSILNLLGFNFSYYTHLGKRGEHNLIWWFNNGLIILGNGEYQIVQANQSSLEGKRVNMSSET